MWNEKTVVIAGGSKGLGLQLAKSFQGHGANVVILARDQERIRTAIDGLNHLKPDIATGISVDLNVEDQLDEAVSQICTANANIDVWVNAVGQSIRTSFSDCKTDDYRRLMEQNFFASVAGSLAALPHLQKCDGHLVNIGSLAAKTAWPFLAPYVSSKHALAGFAKQLRLEGPSNVNYLFVCPGPIRSTATTDRYDVKSRNLPDGAAKPGAGAPVNAIEPKWLAEKIIKFCEKRKTELIVPSKTRLLFSISQLWPSLGDKLVRTICK